MGSVSYPDTVPTASDRERMAVDLLVKISILEALSLRLRYQYRKVRELAWKGIVHDVERAPSQ